MQTDGVRPETTPPPYFAFKTLTNSLDNMRDRGIPNRIDRTFLVGMSGAGQSQFLAGLRSLGLIDTAGVVQPRLIELVNASPPERQRLIGELLHDRYPEAVELGKTNATTGQLMEVFAEYGVHGDTARKAIAFYLQAARYAGSIELSPMFQTPKVTAAPGTRKRNARGTNGAGSNDDENPPPPPPTGLHPALAGVLGDLPKYRDGWTASTRASFMKTLEAVVDFAIPIIPDDGDNQLDDMEVDEDAD